MAINKSRGKFMGRSLFFQLQLHFPIFKLHDETRNITTLYLLYVNLRKAIKLSCIKNFQ